MTQTLLDSLSQSLRHASDYNSAVEVAPVCVLWTDEQRQWEKLIPKLRGAGLTIIALGAYDPDSLTGPAIWLRCMVARMLPAASWPADITPIVYLPGVSRPMLRAVETCAPEYRAIAELQYRASFWSHANGKDWSVAAFLQSESGLGLKLATDAASKQALERSLEALAEQPLEVLRSEPLLSAGFFNSLLDPDQVRTLLGWIGSSGAKQTAWEMQAWDAFCDTCRREYDFDPIGDGPITAARLLGERQGRWAPAWRRFAEAPRQYPGIPDLLREARPNESGLFIDRQSWPQDNEAEEAVLRKDLMSLESLAAAEARNAILTLKRRHEPRCGWVWAELGKAPLAKAILPLAALASYSEYKLVGTSPAAIAESYAAGGWRADMAVLEALAIPKAPDDVQAVKVAIGAIYRPWLLEGAESFQQAVAATPIPLEPGLGSQHPPQAGRCILFADGLRYDVANMLAADLTQANLNVELSWRFSALPTVTSTAKPAISPISERLVGGAELGTTVKGAGTNTTIDVFRRLLTEEGYRILQADETGDPSGSAWTEHGKLDSYGHAQGWMLSIRIDEELRSLADRVQQLLAAGWADVTIVTDHGWLLLPGGLPTAALPEHLTEIRKGRCARMKPGQAAPHQTVRWRWDGDVAIAVAPGISCYVAGKEYEHGGLSVQECVVPVMTITANEPKAKPKIGEIKWLRQRCRVSVTNAAGGAMLDIRLKPGDPSTSVVGEPKPITDGEASAVVEDDSLEGQAVVIVVIGPGGDLFAQQSTIVGGEQA